MVHYCYIMWYPDHKTEKIFKSGGPIDPSYISRIDTNAQGYALAEIHDMPGLKILASIKSMQL